MTREEWRDWSRAIDPDKPKPNHWYELLRNAFGGYTQDMAAASQRQQALMYAGLSQRCCGRCPIHGMTVNSWFAPFAGAAGQWMRGL